MNVLEQAKGGGFRLVTYSIIELVRYLLNQRAKPCVVCGVPTKNMFVNSFTGSHDHVHHPDDPDSIGCKYVWRYWRDSESMTTKGDWLYRHSEEINNGYMDIRDYAEMEFLDERDSYHDYHSYIASREWEIKSYYTKQAAGWRCEKCKKPGNKTTLHLHHKHYKTLYKERRKDVEVLCEGCHAKRHGK